MPRAGNPSWGKSDQPAIVSLTEFEMKVTQLNLAPDQYLGSVELRIWAAAHKNTRYVPESLLKAWGLHPDFPV